MRARKRQPGGARAAALPPTPLGLSVPSSPRAVLCPTAALPLAFSRPPLPPHLTHVPPQARMGPSAAPPADVPLPAAAAAVPRRRGAGGDRYKEEVVGRKIA